MLGISWDNATDHIIIGLTQPINDQLQSEKHFFKWVPFIFHLYASQSNMKSWVFSLWTISTDWETRLLHCVVEHDKNIQNVSNGLRSMAGLSNKLLSSEAPIFLWFLRFHPPLLLCAPNRKTAMLCRLCIKKGSSRDDSCIVSPLKRQTPPSFDNYNFFHTNWLNSNFSMIIIIIWWHRLRFSNKDHL